MSDGDQTAFPARVKGEYTPGITKREYFAALAMRSLINKTIRMDCVPHPDADRYYTRGEIVAQWALQYADALIAALEKPE